MADPLIKSVNQTPRVQDALKKRDQEKKKQRRRRDGPPKAKDKKRIIDTYA